MATKWTCPCCGRIRETEDVSETYCIDCGMWFVGLGKGEWIGSCTGPIEVEDRTWANHDWSDTEVN